MRTMSSRHDLPPSLPPRSAASPWTAPGEQPAGQDAQFIELLNGYRHSGGLARATDVFALLRERGAAGIAAVARWVARREVVYFEWQAETWLPMFQFAAAEMRPHAAVTRSTQELAAVMQPWDVAFWFARPNIDLAGRRPADVVAVEPVAVWQAARADRYLLDA